MASPAEQEVYAAALGILSSRLADSRLIYDEYRAVQELDKQGACSTSAAVQPSNAPRNRYVNVLPYDHNRITLKQHDGSDYINASPIVHQDKTGFSTAYIAAQGPLPATIPDFWQMVWEARCACVVMLTNTHERGSVKCAPYFPNQPGVTMALHGGMQLSLTESVSFHDGDLTQRTLLLQRGDDTLRVVHLHYLAWPDHGTPCDSAAIRTMCERMNSATQEGAATSATTNRRSSSNGIQTTPAAAAAAAATGHVVAGSSAMMVAPAAGPPVVHCSAGIGRTGTFMALDILRMRMQALASRARAQGAGVSSSHAPSSVRHAGGRELCCVMDADDAITGAELFAALDLPHLVCSLRRQRVGMVQTVEQYRFVYQALAEELQAMVAGGSAQM